MSKPCTCKDVFDSIPVVIVVVFSAVGLIFTIFKATEAMSNLNDIFYKINSMEHNFASFYKVEVIDRTQDREIKKRETIERFLTNKFPKEFNTEDSRFTTVGY